MTRIKICGVRTREDALAAVDAGADALGFNFWKPGKRYLEPERAADIVEALPPFVVRVGIFVEENPEQIRNIVGRVGLHAIQVHGKTEPFENTFAEIQDLLASWPRISLVPVIRPKNEDDLNHQLSRLRESGIPAGTFLLDTPCETLPGGTGKAFDWSLAASAKRYGRVILAGGLHPGNVAEAIRTVRPYAVDVASGVEASPGIKDTEKMCAFVRAVRQADAADFTNNEQ